MNRRTFIHTAGATGLSLTSQFGCGATDRAVAVLLNLLEDSPRELIPRELVRLIRRGLRYEDLLSALALAAVRNVQPYPNVGFKYHSVMVLRSIHLTTQHLSSSDKWLPIAWATALAAVRNVQPYPNVGFKYHSVMVLRSIHLTTQHLSSSDKWLPIAWA